MQWVGKNIGTTNLTAPEAYCSLFSTGNKYSGADFYKGILDLWNTDSWGFKDDKTDVWRSQWSDTSLRAPYLASMGRFCKLDYQNGGGIPAREVQGLYGEANPKWADFHSLHSL